MYIRSFGKKAIASVMCTTMLLLASACAADDDSDEVSTSVSFEPINETVTTQDNQEPETTVEAETDGPYVLPDNMYFSELTGEPISKEIENQRPIAVMVDNELKALPHYGTSEADVVYELMNSTANDRITRLMVLVKDWGNIEQLGSIRSTRPTNILLASEWNAVLCHDGGPYYIDQYFEKPWSAHFSGTFSRVNNGKAQEFTEYILNGDLEDNFASHEGEAAYSTTYNEYANPGSHFNFMEYGTELTLSEKYPNTYPATIAALPFPHNQSQLVYNSSTKEYEYYEYDNRHEDADNSAPLSFKNVILQKCSFTQLDEKGYLIYNCINPAETGWYLTNGEAKVIAWSKTSETGPTKYFDDRGEELVINTGKTYIALIPEDTWDTITLQ